MPRPRSTSSSYSTISVPETPITSSPELKAVSTGVAKCSFSSSLTSPTRVYYDNGTGYISPTIVREQRHDRTHLFSTCFNNAQARRTSINRGSCSSYMVPSRTAPFPPPPAPIRSSIKPVITRRPLPLPDPQAISVPIHTRTRVSAKQGSHFLRAKPYTLKRHPTMVSMVAVPDHYWSGMHRKYGGMVPVISVPIETNTRVSDRQGKFLGRGTLRETVHAVVKQDKGKQKKKWWNGKGKELKGTQHSEIVEDVSGWY